MYLWIVLWLGAFVSNVASHWEPCKIQCDKNFSRNEILQKSLIPMCQAGCDLFSGALLSFAPSNVQTETTGPREPKTLPLKMHGIEIETSLENQKKHKQDNHKYIEHLTSLDLSPSIENEINKITNILQVRPLKVVSDTSKTTIEPTSQPVQDHPVEASKQTTTPNGPKKDATKSTTKKEQVGEINQRNDISHIPKLSSEEMHNNKIKKISVTIERNEHKSNEKTPVDKLESEERLEQAKHSCRHECMQAFKVAPEQEACVVGCSLQSTTMSMKTTPENSESTFKSPFGMMQRMFFNLAGHVGKLFRVSWSWASSLHSRPTTEKPHVYVNEFAPRHVQVPIFFGLRPGYVVEQTHNRIETIQIKPQKIPVKVLSEEIFQRQAGPFNNAVSIGISHETPRIITILKESISQHRDREHHHKHAGSEIESKHSKQEKMQDLSSKSLEESDNRSVNDATLDTRRDMSDQQMQHQLDLLECISRKSGLPRWFIAITIFTSAIVVLWLCFSLTAPPDDIKVVKTKTPELRTLIEEEFDDDELTCSEKKKLLASADDVMKMRLETV